MAWDHGVRFRILRLTKAYRRIRTRMALCHFLHFDPIFSFCFLSWQAKKVTKNVLGSLVSLQCGFGGLEKRFLEGTGMGWVGQGDGWCWREASWWHQATQQGLSEAFKLEICRACAVFTKCDNELSSGFFGAHENPRLTPCFFPCGTNGLLNDKFYNFYL